MLLFNLALCAFLAWIPVALGMLLLRRAFMRLARGKQWIAAVVLALVSAGTFVAYVLAAPM